MRNFAMVALFLPLVAGQPARAQSGDTAVDSQAVGLPMMWMHLDSMGTWSPARMQQMNARPPADGHPHDADDGAGRHDGAGNDES
jgi:hypothetical protein